MALNPNQFVTVTPDQEWSGIPTQEWKSHGTISAADALQLVTAEMPRTFTKGEFRRTDWEDLRSGKTTLNDFVPYQHSPRLYQIKYARSRWGEPDSLYRHIQRKGLDSSNAIYVMKNPLNTNQVFLTEGHHRVAAAHAIDPDMPIHFIDEGAHMSLGGVLERANTYSENLRTTEEHLAKYLEDRSGIDRDSYEHDRIRRTAFNFSMDPANIQPTKPDHYHWRDYGWHK